MKTVNTSHLAAAMILLFSVTMQAGATTRTVTSLSDSGVGTLRDTIGASVAGDTIVFTVSGAITLTSGELLVGRDLTITGPGATNLTICGNNASRIFEIANGASVNISGLTIAGGLARGSDAPVAQNAPDGDSGQGGGILNHGNLTLANCYFYNNKAQGGDGYSPLSYESGIGGGGDGGAIYNWGTLKASGCTFYFNRAIGGTGSASQSSSQPSGDGGDAYGGAILNVEFGQPMSLANCTFYLNQCFGGNAGGQALASGNGGIAGGGAISTGSATVSLLNCTLSHNSAIAGNAYATTSQSLGGGLGGNAYGGAVNVDSFHVNLKNSIVAGNNVAGGAGHNSASYNTGTGQGPDFNGPATSQGYNLIGASDGSTGWMATDLRGSSAAPLDPQLGGLHNYGGPTLTMALLANSPAIDAGDDAVLSAPYNLTTDQRGVHRPNGFHVDIGAYEFGGTELVTTFADSGLGSLRQAIASATDGDRVIFTPLITGTIFLTSGELPINNQVSIIGPGATNLTISGNSSSRVFHVSSTGRLELVGLTIADGLLAGTTGTSGSTGTAGGDAIGGGIFNQGTASIIACVVTNCSVTAGRGGASSDSQGVLGGNAAGAGIYNSGVLTLQQSTLSGNSAHGGIGGAGGKVSTTGQAGGAGGSAFGAGLASSGIASLLSCTLAGNSAIAGAGGKGGGGIQTSGGSGGAGGAAYGAALSPFTGSISMTNCTICSNVSVAGNGGPGGTDTSDQTKGPSGSPGSGNSGGLSSSGNAQLQNCLIAGNQAAIYPDVVGSVNSGGFNLVGIADGSTGWLVSEAANLGNSSFPIDPRLGPLQNNGGSTPTMALLNGSPALDKGNSSGSALDQRGFPRISDLGSINNATGGDGSDIGAFEANVAPVLAPYGRGSNPFNILLTGSPGWTYALQASTNIAGSNWVSLTTNASPFIFVDSDAGKFTHRFYRAVSQP